MDVSNRLYFRGCRARACERASLCLCRKWNLGGLSSSHLQCSFQGGKEQKKTARKSKQSKAAEVGNPGS